MRGKFHFSFSKFTKISEKFGRFWGPLEFRPAPEPPNFSARNRKIPFSARNFLFRVPDFDVVENGAAKISKISRKFSRGQNFEGFGFLAGPPKREPRSRSAKPHQGKGGFSARSRGLQGPERGSAGPDPADSPKSADFGRFRPFSGVSGPWPRPRGDIEGSEISALILMAIWSTGPLSKASKSARKPVFEDFGTPDSAILDPLKGSSGL